MGATDRLPQPVSVIYFRESGRLCEMSVLDDSALAAGDPAGWQVASFTLTENPAPDDVALALYEHLGLQDDSEGRTTFVAELELTPPPAHHGRLGESAISVQVARFDRDAALGGAVAVAALLAREGRLPGLYSAKLISEAAPIDRFPAMFSYGADLPEIGAVTAWASGPTEASARRIAGLLLTSR